MSKIIEFKAPKESKECQHDQIKIYNDGVYCVKCEVSISKMWLIRSMRDILFPNYTNTISVQKLRDAMEEREIIRDCKSMELWVEELKLEANKLNKDIANAQVRLLELKSQQDIFRG